MSDDLRNLYKRRSMFAYIPEAMKQTHCYHCKQPFHPRTNPRRIGEKLDGSLIAICATCLEKTVNGD